MARKHVSPNRAIKKNTVIEPKPVKGSKNKIIGHRRILKKKKAKIYETKQQCPTDRIGLTVKKTSKN